MIGKFVRYFYLNQKQPFTGACSRLQKNYYSWVSFSIKLQAHSLKKDSGFPVGLSNISEHFFVKHAWVTTASAKYHFLCCIDLINKKLLSTFVMFWLSLNVFRTKILSRLWAAVSGSPRQLVNLLLIKQAIHSKCWYKLEAVVFFKNYVL